MAAPREMFARFVESTQDWVQERQVGLRLKKFVRVVWVILCEWRPFWITLVGLGGAVGVGWGLGQFADYELSDQIRVAGGFLELLGLATTAYGLKETRKIFGVSSVREQLAGQLERLTSAWKLESHASTIESSVVLTTSESPRGAVRPGPNAPLERRVEALERQYEELNQQLIKAREKLNSSRRRLEEAVKDERRARDEADAQIQEQLESFSVGGLHLEKMGLVWLLVGITLATLPGEIASLLAAFGH